MWPSGNVMPIRVIASLLLSTWLLVVDTEAFAPRPRCRRTTKRTFPSSRLLILYQPPPPQLDLRRESRPHQQLLQAHPIIAAPFLWKRTSVTLLAAGFVVLASIVRRGLLWPGARRDPAYSEPLPPGSLGCPLFGSNILKGNKIKGPEYFYREASAKLGHPRLWKFYFLGAPVASVSGARLVKDLLSREFDTLGALPPKQEKKASEDVKKSSNMVPAVFGNKSIGFERDQNKHAFLRRLVGSSLKGTALTESVPLLVELANDCIDRLSNEQAAFSMHGYSVDYTMDFVQKQLLGIATTSDGERAELRRALDTWLSALFSIASIVQIPFLIQRSKPYKARLYLQSKIQERIEQLQQTGPDTSSLSKMVFAVDEESKAKLTHMEIIENALFLIAAGAETSSSSLTLAVLLLGLHPEAYEKLVQEQTTLQSQGPITESQLSQAPYLDAVISETLRLGAISGGFPRRVRETLIVDGVQIPKGWSVFANYRLTHQLDPVTQLPNDAHMDVQTGFVPERWLHESTRPTEFVPFGAGPRYCLGAELAKMEMKVFLASLARRIPKFRLREGSTNVEWHPASIVPRPLNGAVVEIVG